MKKKTICEKAHKIMTIMTVGFKLMPNSLESHPKKQLRRIEGLIEVVETPF